MFSPLPIDANGYLSLYVSPATSWRPVQAGCTLPFALWPWDRLQPLRDPKFDGQMIRHFHISDSLFFLLGILHIKVISLTFIMCMYVFTH